MVEREVIQKVRERFSSALADSRVFRDEVTLIIRKDGHKDRGCPQALKPHIKEALWGKQVYSINFSNRPGHNSAIPVSA